MKKKFLTVLLAIIAAFCLCFGLVACGDTPKDPAGGTQTEQGSTENNQDDDGEGGDKETEGDEDTNPDGGKEEDEGGDKRPDEGDQGGSEGEGGNTPEEGGGQKPDVGGDQEPEGGGQGGDEHTPDEGGEEQKCAHQYTVENVCSLCGDVWEYTEGLRYDYDEATETYAVGINTNVSGDIVIPYGYQGKFVTKIKNNAFGECKGIMGITIPDSVQMIETGAFFISGSINNLEHITVTEDNPNYKSEQECLIEKETNTLILGCKNSVIPNDITAIGDYAFYNCSELTDIAISDSVTTIGYMAFDGTAYFNDPSHWDADGVLYIGNHLIKAKPTLAGAYTVRAGTKTIAAWAFSEVAPDPEICLDLTSIVIPDSVVSIGWYAFGECAGLKEVTIGSGVTNIERYKLVTDTRTAYLSPFTECCGLEHITVSDKNPMYRSEGVCLIERKTNTLILGSNYSIIPEGVTSISDLAFYGCKKLTSITIPTTVTKIGRSAFLSCIGLTSMTIPDSVTEIGDRAFDACYGLTGVYITDLAAWCKIDFENGGANPLVYAHHLYLDGVEVKNLTIPAEITEIKEYTFCGCEGLKSVTIPDSVTSIGEGAFSNCSGLTDITIPDGVTSIGKWAFLWCSGLTSVTIGSGVTSIGEEAFSWCEMKDIQFKGTVEEWQAIEKGNYWDDYTPNYTVTCTNGTVDKKGNVTYFGE